MSDNHNTKSKDGKKNKKNKLQDVLPNPFFGTKSKNKNQNNNQNHGSDGHYNPNHLVPTS
ncbi:unnamed protein product, partial [Oppiella nova]